MHETSVDNTERLDESVLVQRRLLAVQEQALSGDYERPLAFLAGLEVEFQVLEYPQIVDLFADEQPRTLAQEQLIQKHGIIIPSENGDLLRAVSSVDYQVGLREEARQHVSALRPQTADETARQQDWLRNVDTFDTTDLINFRLYREFSQPMLEATAPPQNVSYEEMLVHGSQVGWLEFRFGNGTLQEGYYDNPNVCELRLTPCPPDELVRREEIVLQRLADISAEYGFVALRAGAHLNLSAYSPDASEGEESWLPIINNSMLPDGQQVTLDAVSGMNAAIEDGVWMSAQGAQDRFLFGDTAASKHWKIGPVRGTIRLLEGYAELREKNLQPSTAQGLLWLMTGISYGLEHGAQHLAQEGYTPATVAQRSMALRTEHFDKQTDLDLQRAIEQSTLQEQGGFDLDSHYNIDRGRRLAARIFGEDVLDGAQSYIFNRLLMYGLDIDDEGRLSLNRPVFEASFAQLGDATRSYIAEKAESIGLTQMMELAAQYIDRDAIRVQAVDSLSAIAAYPGLEPDQWVERWRTSPLMERAYGDQTATYAAYLGRVANEHYEPIDLNDWESYKRAITELLGRRKTA